MKHLPKKLVYHFYANKNTINSELNKIHLNSLKIYSKIFDSASVTICVDNIKDKNFINDIMRRVNNVLDIKEIDYHIKENTPLYEAKTFYEEVMCKLNENDLIFFAHNKGTTTCYSSKFWIETMYFLCLNFEESLISLFINSQFMCFLGAFIEFDDNNTLSHLSAFPGTFFWVNCKNLQLIINDNKMDDIFVVNNRFYGEIVPGRIFYNLNKTDNLDVCDIFLANGNNIYTSFFADNVLASDNAKEVFEYIIGNKIEDFNVYKKKVEN